MAQLCIFCLERPATTGKGDHVPPKGLFAKPRPSTLVTVPACRECNTRFGADDDYFLNLALELEVAETASGREISDKRVRAIARSLREKMGSGKSLVDSFVPVYVQQGAGSLILPTWAFRLDRNRIVGTAARIIRGLYFEFTGRATPLPLACPVRVHMMDQPDEIPGGQSEADFRFLLAHMSRRTIQPGVFDVWYHVAPEKPTASMWFLEVYGRFHFVGSTGADQEIMSAFSTE